ncbi:sulfuric ester hydrolase [Aureococcus anophagefferens]|nr:sulfuric ester hydrolase [Aureococcus anophagefferens]
MADVPLFLTVSYQAVHAPIQVPDEYVDGSAYANGCESLRAGSASATRLRRQLCGMVSMVDESLASIHDDLKAEAMWENTLLFFLSDNGGILRHGSSNLDLRGEKGSYYEGGIRVPAFVSGGYLAKHLSAGRVFEGLVGHLRRLEPGQQPQSYAETALDDVLSHEHLTDSLDGVDQWDAFVSGASAAASQRTHVAHNINSELFGAAGALRVGEYKLIVEARVTESEIYEYGQHMLQDDNWDQRALGPRRLLVRRRGWWIVASLGE